MKEERRGREDPGSSLRHRMELGRLILDITTRFVNIQPHEVDAALKQSLEDLGRFAGADRAFLFQFDDRRTAALLFVAPLVLAQHLARGLGLRARRGLFVGSRRQPRDRQRGLKLGDPGARLVQQQPGIVDPCLGDKAAFQQL